jgi:dipeptidyl aminopeptidase/acylaminoacyl peptidase
MLEGIRFSEPEVITYPSKDGLAIEGFLFRPPEPLGKPGPAILWVHGGPNAVFAKGWEPGLQFLVQRGYTVFAPNFRGSTGYGKAFMEANMRQAANKDVQDWVAAAELLRKMPEVDGRRIAIMGRSYGGLATLQCLGQFPEVFQAGVAIAAPTNQFMYWEETELTWTLRHRFKRMGLPSANQPLHHQRSWDEYAEFFQAPVLLLHGDADAGVPSSQARQMAAELERFSKTYECRIYPGEGHAFHGPDAILDSTARIERFLGTHLGV